MVDEIFFAWEGANHPEGPWRHLRVLEMHGTETLSELFRFELELVRIDNAAEVDVDELIGAAAALRITTRTEPEFRIIHGVVSAAQELGEMDGGTRYRVVLSPPLIRATMMRKSRIYLEKTLEEIIEKALQFTARGAGLQLVEPNAMLSDDGNFETYTTPTQTFAWRLVDEQRISDAEARPYVVQYDEDDFSFVSRLLEEEGISYHFEHGSQHCMLVLSDYDVGRHTVAAPLGPAMLGREVHRWSPGRRLRPNSAALDDYNWQKPQLELVTAGPAGTTDFMDMHYPGRYEHSKATGAILATKREQRLDTERQYAEGSGHCRMLGAGVVFTLEHPTSRFNGNYLVTSIRHRANQGGSFGKQRADENLYSNDFEVLRCGTRDSAGESNYRPPMRTRRPRIYGTQTAIVTAEPGSDAEINVGGATNQGSVRVLFHWDLAYSRHEVEPTSCWIRVSQLFAGGNHGAMWHPRVGNEVIVEFLDGDPDRPIVTGRVYNGTNLPPADATARPTYSAIKSLTSPHDGNYNLLSFEDLQGEEEITIHAARDYNINVERHCSRGAAGHDEISITGYQKINIGDYQLTGVASSITTVCTGGPITFDAAANFNVSAGADIDLHAAANINAAADACIIATAGAVASCTAPLTAITGTAVLLAHGGAVAMLTSGGVVNVAGPTIFVGGTDVSIVGGGSVKITGGTVDVSGSTVTIDGVVNICGGTTSISGGDTSISGGTTSIEGDTTIAGSLGVSGGTVNLN